MGRKFWMRLCLFNLAIVAMLGFGLRSKILFSLPMIDFRNLESAHSHFAFAGWVGLALITMLIYDLLPLSLAGKKIYQWLLAIIQFSSIGMAATFPFMGYNAVTIFFSTLFILTIVVFLPVYVKDILRLRWNKTIKLLVLGSLASMLLSFLGTLGLLYIIVTNEGSSNLYRDSIYTFLHFQYNGFFTLAVFALLLSAIESKGIPIDKNARPFAVFLCLSVIPALFLSLLWHNSVLFYILAGLGCICILVSLYYFFGLVRKLPHAAIFSTPIARTLWYFSAISFSLKMLLNIGTIIPQLGDAVYGDRPIIIGFLHLVFLGFISFYILATLVENQYLSRNGKVMAIPLVVFSIGIFANEAFLMIQGLSILLFMNSEIYQWLLWGAAIVLFTGATMIAISSTRAGSNEKSHGDHGL